MTVLLVGRDYGHEFGLMREAVEQRGGTVEVVDVDDWPSEKPITLDGAAKTVRIGSREYGFGEVEGAYVKVNCLFLPVVEDRVDGTVSESENPYAAMTQLREYRGAFLSIFETLAHHGTTVVPNADAFRWEEVKPYACELFESLGLATPDWLTTVDSAAAKRFLREHGTVVYKPVAGFGGVNLLTAEEADQLDEFATPVLFQEFVPGEDVRAYVVDGEYRGAFRYVTDDDDFSFKASPGNPDAEAVELPQDVRDAVCRAVEASPTNYSAVDLRRRDDGSFVVLETNPGGRFMLADSAGVTDVAGALADFVLDG